MSCRAKKDESGAAAVEFAIVLPVLLLLVFGIIEFGLLFNRYITVTHAAREGVRVAALAGPTVDPLTGKTKGVTAGETSAPGIVSAIACAEAVDTATSEVTMTCDTTYDFALFIFTGPIDLSSTAKMRTE
jgi:Flp pilus assembly protein TadG